ncbi:MAG: DegQ family serine endoprotease [Oceanococcaceae bacterium]
MRTAFRSLRIVALLALPLALSTGHAGIPLPTKADGTPSLAPMLKSVTPAVVNVYTRGTQQAQHPMLNDPNFRFFFGDRMPEREVRGLGSGVIVDAQAGTVLTNAHVVDNADEIRVRLADDREFKAELVGTDPDSDIAVLKIDAENLVDVEIGNSQSLEVGDFVVAIGNPFGLRQTVTSGIVSALGRSGLGNRYENFIQTDASINRGNSGGALVGLDGKLVGINTAIISTTGGSVGIGFAIPTQLAMSVMEQILEHGSVKRGMLGVIGQDLTPELAEAFGLEKGRGAVVAEVMDDSAADAGGLEAGDVITRVNDQEIRDFDALRNAIGLNREGDKVKITYLRNGKTRTTSVVLGSSEQLQASSSDLHPKLADVTFADATDDDAGKGVVVSAIAADSPAARAGLRQGDIVDAINRKEVRNLTDLRNHLSNEDEDSNLLLRVRRGQGALFLLIR